jgi:hypothetical protein
MTPARRRALLEALLLVLLCATAAAWWQWRTGAWNVETVRHPDESAHYMNSLAVAESLRGGWASNPLAFVKDFYLHYPALAPLVWPPLFHLLAGAWMALFGLSEQSALAFVAVASGATLALFYCLGRKAFGAPAAAALAAALWALRLMADLTTTIMIDVLLVAGALAAAWCAALWLDQPEARWTRAGVAAGLWGATKANGLAALPALLLAALLWRLVRHAWRSAIRAATLAATLSVPFAAISLLLLRGHNPPQPAGWAAAWNRLAWYEMNLRWQFGAAVEALAVAGLAWTAAALWKRRASALDAAMLATLAALLGFHVLLPLTHNERYLAPMLPLVLYFAAASGRWLPWQAGPALAASLAAVLLLTLRFEVTPQQRAGFRDAAELLRRTQPAPLRVLVVSDEPGETAFTAEMASSDARRRDFVLRGAKTLSDSDWYGGSYHLAATTPPQAATLIEDLGIQWILIDCTNPAAARPDLRLVLDTVSSMPSRFPEAWRIERARRLLLCRVSRPASPPRRPIAYSLSRSLNITVSESPPDAR